MRAVLPLLLLLTAASCGTPERPPAAAAKGPPAPPPEGPPPPPKLRLGGEVRPVGYDVTLTILPDQDPFDGEVNITLDLLAPTTFFWLHGDDLTIADARLRTGERELPLRVVRPGTGGGFLGFALGAPAGPGRAELRVRYRGQLSRRDNDGLFRQQEGGDWYAYSDFEPTDARRAFPCFDEPSYKVPWQLTLRVRREHSALANTPVESEQEEAGGLKRVRFRRTPPLPSYLVALAVGPFELVDAGRAGRKATPLRIVAFRGRGAEARYAARTAGELVRLLEDYFDLPYPYEKLDQIAVPRFGGAMENPGLITYGQSLLLIKPAEETAHSRRRYASLAAHELAHQWFGDLVTMRFWDDIWLNEAFASWMGDLVLEKFQPGWDVPTGRVRARARAMAEDSLTTARRVRQPIETSHDIHNAFDAITYEKGQAVLGMFERYLGAERFRAGVRRFLREHAHGNAGLDDFLAALTAEGAPEVAPAVRSFLEQPGLPLVSAELRCDQRAPGAGRTRGGAAPQLQLRQGRYLPLGAGPPPAGAPPLWQIPVCARYGAQQACALLTTTEGALPLPGLTGCGGLVVPNAGALGYYRVRYGEGMLQRLLRGGGAELQPPERAAVLDDVIALLGSGDLPADEALGQALRLAGERNRHVLQGLMRLLGGLRPHLVRREAWPALARLVRATFGPRARALGLRLRPAEDEEAQLLRRELVGLVGTVGEDPALLAEARRLAEAWLRDRAALRPEEAELVLPLAAHHGDEQLFARLLAAAREARTQAERTRIIRALGAFRGPGLAALQERALNLVLSSEFDVRDTDRLLRAFDDDEEAAERAYRFIKAHYDELVARLPRSGGARLIWSAAAFCDEAHRADAEAFFRERAPEVPGGPRELAQALEQIQQCAALRAAQQERVTAFLLRHRP